MPVRYSTNNFKFDELETIHRYHHLKLYPEDDSGSMSVKKPVVVESYDEVVFAEPLESLFARVQNHPAVVVPRLPAGFSLPPGEVIFCDLYFSYVIILLTITRFLF